MRATYLGKVHYGLLIASFVLVAIGFLLCFNYFFVSGIGADDIIANISLILAFGSVIWYMLKGYKNPSDLVLGIPMLMYVLCVIIMVSTISVSIGQPVPFVIASMCTTIVYPVVIVFCQQRIRLCTILFAILIISEVWNPYFVYRLYAPAGIFFGGSITATMQNIHIFVRGFMVSALGLCYAARYLHNKETGSF